MTEFDFKNPRYENADGLLVVDIHHATYGWVPYNVVEGTPEWDVVMASKSKIAPFVERERSKEEIRAEKVAYTRIHLQRLIIQGKEVAYGDSGIMRLSGDLQSQTELANLATAAQSSAKKAEFSVEDAEGNLHRMTASDVIEIQKAATAWVTALKTRAMEIVSMDVLPENVEDPKLWDV